METIEIAIFGIALMLILFFTPMIFNAVKDHLDRPLTQDEKVWYLARMEGLNPRDPKVKAKLIAIRFGMRERRKWPDLKQLTWKERRIRHRFILNHPYP